jgi:hypothetical protein
MMAKECTGTLEIDIIQTLQKIVVLRRRHHMEEWKVEEAIEVSLWLFSCFCTAVMRGSRRGGHF